MSFSALELLKTRKNKGALECIKSHQDSPMFRNKEWIVMGDFNEILEIKEHSSYEDSGFISSGMRDFESLVQYCSFMDRVLSDQNSPGVTEGMTGSFVRSWTDSWSIKVGYIIVLKLMECLRLKGVLTT